MACIEDRHIVIRATTNEQNPDGIAFEMLEKKNGKETPVPNDRIGCNKQPAHSKKNDYHSVAFVLDDKTGRKLRFLKDIDEVMWVNAGDKAGNPAHMPACPTNSSKDDDFAVESVTSDVLVVRNVNSRRSEHKFALNFFGKKADGTTGLIQYDPGWGNGNGGTDRS